ncbi:MAG: glycosyltransferase [Deltaproteobacteria bacterium]|nr:glycosyltransferase [Deltaproteobacteria bacterium]
MDTAIVALLVGAGLTSCFWLVANLTCVRVARRLRALSDGRVPEPEAWPRLTVVVPACNEAAVLEPALATLLAQDYPDLELLLVNDRSTDGTDRVVEELAARDPRVRAVHVRALPAGWLGKVHACHVGLGEASGAFVLFTDADVHYAPGVLRRAVSLAVARKLDQLSLMPRFVSPTFWLRVAVNAFAALFMVQVRPERVEDPRRPDYCGVGAFNLVRRTALDPAEGLGWLRLEVADDVGLGLLVKRRGGRCEVRAAPVELAVEWYSSLGAMFRGLEKNMFSVIGRFSVVLIAARMLMMLVAIVGPFLALGLPALGLSGALAQHVPRSALLAVGAAGLLAWGSVPLVSAAMRARFGTPFGPGLLGPLGLFLLLLMVARSTWACVRRGAILWRGTAYPLRELAAHQRVKK